jgi:membrane protein
VKEKLQSGFHLVRSTFQEFIDDDCPSVAAALAYYTVFSLPPLLMLIIMIAGTAWDEQTVRGELRGHVRSLFGAQVAEQVQIMIRYVSGRTAGGRLAASLGIAALVFAATTAFAQLQYSINRIWGVRPDPKAGGLRHFLMKRVLSFGMIVSIAFLLLISFALSAALGILGDHLDPLLPGGISTTLLRALHLAVSFAIITLLFATMFKVLPDARIAWRDVWLGGVVTALLFVAGKFAVGLYLSNSDLTSAYGAAGSLAVILLWTYYSAMIFLLGAEFTEVWTEHHGHGIQPVNGAVRASKWSKQEVSVS